MLFVPRRPSLSTRVARERLEALVPRGARRCPRCGEEKRYPLADGRLRCTACAYTHRFLTGRFLEKPALPEEYWCALIARFARGEPATRMAEEMCLNYATAHKASCSIRRAILCAEEGGERLLDAAGNPIPFCSKLMACSPCSGQAADPEAEKEMACLECSSPVFGLVERGPRSKLVLLTRTRARDVFALDLELAHWRSFVVTSPHAGGKADYTALIFSCCATAKRVFQARFTEQPLPYHESTYCAFAEDGFAAYPRISPEYAYLYLTEFAFRLAHRDAGIGRLEDTLARAALALVPKRKH